MPAPAPSPSPGSALGLDQLILNFRLSAYALTTAVKPTSSNVNGVKVDLYVEVEVDGALSEVDVGVLSEVEVDVGVEVEVDRVLVES